MNALLVMFKSDGERRDFPLGKDAVILGRKHTCDLRIPLSSVSREHCQIERRGEALYLRDLGSSNGTYHNDTRIHEVELKPGDRVVVGPVHFTVVIDGEPADVQPVQTVMPDGAGEVEDARPRPESPAVADDDVPEVEELEVEEVAEVAEVAEAEDEPLPVEQVEEIEEVQELDVVAEPESEPADFGVSTDADSDDDDDDPIAALEKLMGGDEEASVVSEDDDSISLLDDEDER